MGFSVAAATLLAAVTALLPSLRAVRLAIADTLRME
jgi:ABC-type lipoprotein release transport system permease subunit